MRHHALSKLAALALVLAVTTPVVTAADVRLSGIGIRKCSEWNAWKDSNNGEARATMLEWAQGFTPATITMPGSAATWRHRSSPTQRSWSL